MPYKDGSTPTEGDRVRSQRGKTGTVTQVQLNYPSLPGHDALSIKFDDGSHIAISAADEYTFVSKAVPVYKCPVCGKGFTPSEFDAHVPCPKP
jgi:hypothetical protein